MKTLTKMFTLSCWSLLTMSLLFSANSVEDKLRLEQERLEQKNAGQPVIHAGHEDCTHEEAESTAKPMTVPVDVTAGKEQNILVPSADYQNQDAIDKRAHYEAKMEYLNSGTTETAVFGEKSSAAKVNSESNNPLQDKINFYHNLKKNPGNPAPYEGSRDCVDTDNGATDPYGDGCAAYNNYPSWCGNYNDDDFDSGAMCCICGGGEDDGTGSDDGGSDDAGSDDGGSSCEANAIILTVGGGSWDSEISWTIDLNEEFVASGAAPSTTELCLNDGDYTFSGCDAYGDGWNSATATATDADGNVIFSWAGPDAALAANECEAVTMSVGGAPPVGGCTDVNAPNYDADAEVDDGSCEDYCSDESGSCGYWLGMGYTCDQLVGYGYDCTACEADGTCDAGFTCTDGSEVDAPENCEACAFDYTANGAASCDAAWDAFGLDCATLEASYNWDCTGCSCPGDSAGDDGGNIDCDVAWDMCLETLVGTEWYDACSAEDCDGGPGGACDGNYVPYLSEECGAVAYFIGSGQCDDPCAGGSADGGGECVDTDNGATDPYGDGCDAYNNYPSWCGNYNDDDFVSEDMCCICGGGSSDGSDDGGTDDGGDCEDSDNGATDPYGDGCDAYANYPSWCGGYDDDDFQSCDMCCACEGTSGCESSSDDGGGEGCGEGYWDCGDGQCIPASYQCDGSAEFGNAGWGPDCTNGADEGADCCDGSFSAYGDCSDLTDCAGDFGGSAVEGCDGVCGSGLVFDDCGVCDGDNTSCSCTNYTIVVGGGAYDSEMAWDLQDADGNTIATAGCDTPNSYGICEGGGNGTFDVCLYEGVYDVYGYDAFGDGWNGGYWTLYNEDGSVAAGGPEFTFEDMDDYPYGWGWTWDYCLGNCGCTLEDAPNYDPDAEINYDCEYWTGMSCDIFGSPGYILGCGATPAHCYLDDEEYGYQTMLGDGTCDAHACGGDDQFCHGLACEYFDCDGGDCTDCAGECNGVDPVLPSYDCENAAGDLVCDESDCPEACGGVELVVGGGSWDSEITWSLDGADDYFTSGAAGTFCLELADGEYGFTGCDAYGDGWNGATANFYVDGTLTSTWAGPDAALGANECESIMITIGGDAPVAGCTDSSAPEYDPEATLDDGSCWASCEGFINYISDGWCDASNNNEGCGYDGGDCCPGDCVDSTYSCEQYGGTCEDCVDPSSADLAEGGDCYDDGTDDGGTGDWDAVVTNFTAEGVDYYGDAAVSWTWDTLLDGTSCEENDQITCPDGSCADSEDLCEEIPWADCTGTISWLGDGYCDGSNNNEACGWDLGDCCPGDCEATVAEGCPDNPDGCYSTISCGDCGSCDDPNSPDNADGGACSDYVQWTDAECAASVTIVGSADLDGDGYIGDNDLCYSDGTGYFSFNWEGGCTGTNLYYIDADGVEQNLDLTAYGFTGGFYFYGFGNLEEIPFIVSFAEADTDLIVAATDCPGDDTADDGGADDGGSDDGGSGDCVDTDNGATDPYGDGCAAYNDYPSWCGNYDDDDFLSMEMCCICGGGEGGAGSDDGGSDDAGSDDGGEDCEDSDNGATDPYGDDCAAYANYPSWCGGYDDDDFISCEMCCACADEAACTGVMSHEENVPALSINASYNAKNFQNEIAVFKKNSIDLKAADIAVDFSHEGAMFNLETMEFTPGSNSSSNRTVSYTLDVACNSCLSGGPWSGAWEVATAEFLVYGFDDASTVCATVTATSTEYGSTAPSDEQCVAAGDQSACEFFDCSGQEACGYEGWVGDGYCDDGTYDLFFNCADFNCDEGDCVVECWDGSTACAGNTECPEEPTCSAGDVNDDGNVNVSDIVVVVNFILGGGTTGDVCEGDMNGDAVVNVSDIVQIVNYILGGGTARLDSASNADVVVTNNSISVEANGFVQGVQMTLTHGDDFTIELADAYISDYRTIGNTTTLLVVTDGTESLSEVASITGKCTVETATVATPAGEAQSDVSMEIASAFEVKVAGPNPFNPSTSLNVIVDQAGYVSVKVFNLMGQQVATLADGYMDANSAGYTLHWNASQMASGVYLVHAESAGKVSTQKLMLLK